MPLEAARQELLRLGPGGRLAVFEDAPELSVVLSCFLFFSLSERTLLCRTCHLWRPRRFLVLRRRGSVASLSLLSRPRLLGLVSLADLDAADAALRPPESYSDLVKARTQHTAGEARFRLTPRRIKASKRAAL